MGIAKYYEDIQEEIEERMRASGRNYYASTSDYPRKKLLTTTDYRAKLPVTSTSKIITPTFNPPKQKIGYIIRNYERYGIEIYFYRRPDESVLSSLKSNGWHWHRTKKCWYRKYSSANQQFAEKIIEQ